MKKVSPKPPSKTLNAPNCRLAKKGVIFFAIARLKFWSSFRGSLRGVGAELGQSPDKENVLGSFCVLQKITPLERAFLFESGAKSFFFGFVNIPFPLAECGVSAARNILERHMKIFSKWVAFGAVQRIFSLRL
ncbi:MAG: hypothetical protein IJX08_07010 [Clostridia bacterium]|nr:hypothetical protein [Clostridia bacterium]